MLAACTGSSKDRITGSEGLILTGSVGDGPSVGADIRVEKTDIYGYYTVQPGDTLSKIAKWHLGNAMSYMKIFNINTDILDNPDLIKVGQRLKLPNKE